MDNAAAAEVPDPGVNSRQGPHPRGADNEGRLNANKPVDMAANAAAAAGGEGGADDGFDTLFEGHVSWMEYAREAEPESTTRVDNTMKIAAFRGNGDLPPVAGVRAPDLRQIFQAAVLPERVNLIITSYSWTQLMSLNMGQGIRIMVQIGDSPSTRDLKEMLSGNETGKTGVIFTNPRDELRVNDVGTFLGERQTQYPVILVLHNPDSSSPYFRGIILCGAGFHRGCATCLLMEYSPMLRTPCTGCVVRGFQAPVRHNLGGNGHHQMGHVFGQMIMPPGPGLHLHPIRIQPAYPVPQYPPAAAAALAPENRADVLPPPVNRPLPNLVAAPPPPAPDPDPQPNNNNNAQEDPEDEPEADNAGDNNGIPNGLMEAARRIFGGILEHVANPDNMPADGQERHYYFQYLDPVRPYQPRNMQIAQELLDYIGVNGGVEAAAPHVHHRNMDYRSLFQNYHWAAGQQEREMTPEWGYLDALEEMEEQHKYVQ